MFLNTMEYTIYKIVCKDENIKDCYVGSTKDFNGRQLCHKSRTYTNCNFKLYNFIRNNGNFDNFTFEVIETLICENKNEALIRERFWIEELNPTLNKLIPCRTDKEYYDDNKERYKIYRKTYREDNKNEIQQKNKIYRDNNKSFRYEKIICVCGCKYTRNNKSRHEKSKKHLDYLSSLPVGL